VHCLWEHMVPGASMGGWGPTWSCYDAASVVAAAAAAPLLSASFPPAPAACIICVCELSGEQLNHPTVWWCDWLGEHEGSAQASYSIG
jgi:hypothetical protein